VACSRLNFKVMCLAVFSSLKHKHTNKNSTLKVLEHLFNILQILHTKLEKFNEFAAERPEKTLAMNCLSVSTVHKHSSSPFTFVMAGVNT